MNTKWNGRTFSLENFTGLYQSSFFKLQEADEHIAFQLPTGHTRVGYLLDKTQNNNPNLRAANAIICINNNGMIEYVETTVAFVLSRYPYSKQRNNSNNNAQISDVNIKGKFQSKTGIRRINTRS